MTTGTSTNSTTTNSTSKGSLLSSLFQDLGERFLKWGTIRGLVLIPLGVIGIVIVLTDFRFILHALAALVFGIAIVEGLYQLLHNPVKRQMALDDLIVLRTDTEDFLQHLSRLATKKFGFPVQFAGLTPEQLAAANAVGAPGATSPSAGQAASTADSANSTTSSTTSGQAGTTGADASATAQSSTSPTKQLGITGTTGSSS